MRQLFYAYSCKTGYTGNGFDCKDTNNIITTKNVWSLWITNKSKTTKASSFNWYYAKIKFVDIVCKYLGNFSENIQGGLLNDFIVQFSVY